MVNALLWCRDITCKRISPHRTRRRDADGAASCLGKHAQCFMSPRGIAKTKSVTKANAEKNKRSQIIIGCFRPCLRHRVKKPPVLQLRYDAPDALRYSLATTSDGQPPRPPDVARACGIEDTTTAGHPLGASGVAHACGIGDTTSAGHPHDPLYVARACGIGAGSFGILDESSALDVVNSIIDGVLLKQHFRPADLLHVKALAWTILDKLACCKPHVIQGPSHALALAVFNTALALSPGGKPTRETPEGPVSMTEAQVCRLVQPDNIIRREAHAIQARLLNVLFSHCGADESAFAACVRLGGGA
jgi:hypothetical protein